MSTHRLAIFAATGLACGGSSAPRAEGPRIVSSNMLEQPSQLSAAVESDDRGLHLVVTAADTCEIIRETAFPEGGYIRRKETAGCNQRPVAKMPVTLRVGDSAPTEIALGVTDGQGRLEVPWHQIAGQLPSGAGAMAEVFAGEPATTVGKVSITPAVEGLAERAWTQAAGSGTATDLADFRARFPDSHAEEARTRYLTARTRELVVQVEAALAEKAFPRAAELLAEWNQLAAEDPRRIELAARFAGARHDHMVGELAARFDAAAATAGLGGAAEVDALTQATAALAELERVAGKDRRTRDRARSLTKLRTRLVGDHLTATRRHLRSKEYDEAASQLAAAEAIDPGNRQVARERAALERKRSR